MNEMFPYAKLFRRFAEGICRKPLQLAVREATPTSQKIILFVTANPTDAKFLCGPGCRTIKAIQQIFIRIARVAGHHITIKVDGNGMAADKEPLFKVKENWDRTPELVDILTTCLQAMRLGEIDIVAEEHHDTTMLTLNSPELPEDLLAAFNEALNEWGKGQGRCVMIVTPKMVKAA